MNPVHPSQAPGIADGGDGASAPRPSAGLTPIDESESMVCVNPATGEEIGRVPKLTAADVCALAERARAAQPGWQALGFRGRGLVLRRLQRWMLDHRDDVIAAVQRETGRAFEDSVLELASTVNSLGFWARRAPDYLADERVRSWAPFVLGKRLRVRYQPRGLIGVIAPWNFPIALGFGDAVPGLAAGNSVIVKPSEVTPLSIEVVLRGMKECGAPEGVFQVATGAGETGAALIDEADFIMFTGSGATGRKVMARAAETLTPVGLELGGKDAMIVLADAELTRASNLAVYGAMLNSGQVCLSTERVYVEAPVYDEFVARVVEKVRALRQGVPGGPGSVEVGAMILPQQVEMIEGHVADAVERGARVLVGGKRGDEAGRFFEPTVLVDVDHSMACLREETFGPTLPIMKVADAEEAVRLANDSGYGLGATICTRDVRKGERLAARVRAGTVSVNDIFMHFMAPALPMGGLKESGLGARHGAEGIRKYCERRAMLTSRWHLRRDLGMYPFSRGRSGALLRGLALIYGTAARAAAWRAEQPLIAAQRANANEHDAGGSRG